MEDALDACDLHLNNGHEGESFMNMQRQNKSKLDEASLITVNVYPFNSCHGLTALLDSGASRSFARREVLRYFGIDLEEPSSSLPKVSVILADGAKVDIVKQEVTIEYIMCGHSMKETFIIMDLHSKFDLVLGTPWFQVYQPVIDWKYLSVKAFGSSDHADQMYHVDVPVDVGIRDPTSHGLMELRSGSQPERDARCLLRVHRRK